MKLSEAIRKGFDESEYGQCGGRYMDPLRDCMCATTAAAFGAACEFAGTEYFWGQCPTGRGWASDSEWHDLILDMTMLLDFTPFEIQEDEFTPRQWEYLRECVSEDSFPEIIWMGDALGVVRILNDFDGISWGDIVQYLDGKGN